MYLKSKVLCDHKRSCPLTAGMNVFNGWSLDDELLFAENVKFEELGIVVDKRLCYARHCSVLQAIRIEYY